MRSAITARGSEEKAALYMLAHSTVSDDLIVR